jgi:hypothetical protein
MSWPEVYKMEKIDANLCLWVCLPANGTGWRSSNNRDPIFSAPKTTDFVNLAATSPKIGGDVIHGDRVAIVLSMLQCPLMNRLVHAAEIVDARIYTPGISALRENRWPHENIGQEAINRDCQSHPISGFNPHNSDDA